MPAARKKTSRKAAKPQYDNTNTGALWPNENKLSPKHPDYTGTLDVEGVLYRIAVWDRDNSANPAAPIMGIQIDVAPTRNNRRTS